MSVPGLHFLCVLVLAVVSAEVLPSEEGVTGSAVDPEPRVFYIYPRTGRLFHADYVRDNEVFRSLERTNFMRRGPFAGGKRRRTKRDGEEEPVKKHVYVDTGRISSGGKKSVLGKVKEDPIKFLTKARNEATRSKPQETVERVKRETRYKEEDVKSDKLMPQNGEATGLSENSVDNNASFEPNKTHINSSESTNSTDKENVVEGEDYSTHTKNNDTDKTLFVLDPVAHQERSPVRDSVPEVGVVIGDMEKTVVEDDIKLYPVYRGVKYTYPQVERRLLYAPPMTIETEETPEVTEFLRSSGNNSSSGVEEGRGRRRRYKKIAFPLLLALKMKAVLMLPLILGMISLVAFKGLWSGLTALGVAAALGLKALVSSGGPRVVVQAPPPPHYHHPPPHEYAEYWSRRDDFSDYRPSSWS